jgi:hypothetical protein
MLNSVVKKSNISLLQRLANIQLEQKKTFENEAIYVTKWAADIIESYIVHERYVVLQLAEARQ